jgi:hypothetical protein
MNPPFDFFSFNEGYFKRVECLDDVPKYFNIILQLFLLGIISLPNLVDD